MTTWPEEGRVEETGVLSEGVKLFICFGAELGLAPEDELFF